VFFINGYFIVKSVLLSKFNFKKLIKEMTEDGAMNNNAGEYFY